MSEGLDKQGFNPKPSEPPVDPMEITRILMEVAEGRIDATNALIPMVYQELHDIAAMKLGQESDGQTLQATALVHEAYLRLLNPDNESWQNRRHFFGAAAEAMRRILIETARRKKALKHGGNLHRIGVEPDKLPVPASDVDLLDLNEALLKLEQVDPEAAELVSLRYFAGLTMRQIAEVLDISPRTADNLWVFAKAWLYRHLQG